MCPAVALQGADLDEKQYSEAFDSTQLCFVCLFVLIIRQQSAAVMYEAQCEKIYIYIYFYICAFQDTQEHVNKKKQASQTKQQRGPITQAKLTE